MSDYLAIEAIISGIVDSNNAAKQSLGRRFAARLGLDPGSLGADGGIDGDGEINGEKIYFQSKLIGELINASYAADFCGNFVIHQADIGIMLAGIGYTSGFEKRLELFEQGMQKWTDSYQVKIHLLTLEDIFAETPAFEEAVKDLPPLRDLAGGVWETFR